MQNADLVSTVGGMGDCIESPSGPPSASERQVWLGFDRQKQTLNGVDYKKLEVGRASLGYARMQVRVSQTADLTYDVYGGGVAVTTPEIRF